MKIAIVGFGISGAALLMSLKTSGKLDADIHVDIFDPNNELAVGLAYGKDDNNLLLNAFQLPCFNFLEKINLNFQNG